MLGQKCVTIPCCCAPLNHHKTFSLCFLSTTLLAKVTNTRARHWQYILEAPSRPCRCHVPHGMWHVHRRSFQWQSCRGRQVWVSTCLGGGGSPTQRSPKSHRRTLRLSSSRACNSEHQSRPLTGSHTHTQAHLSGSCSTAARLAPHYTVMFVTLCALSMRLKMPAMTLLGPIS